MPCVVTGHRQACSQAPVVSPSVLGSGLTPTCRLTLSSDPRAEGLWSC